MSPLRRPFLHALPLALLLLGGCTLAPRYVPPQAPAVAGWKEAGDWMPASAAIAPAGAQPWWSAFGDAQLDALEGRLGHSSPEVAAAVARFLQARALAQRARATVFPLLQAHASATREHGSANSPLAVTRGATARTLNDFIAGFDLSWEIDLFGRLRSAAAAARAQSQAAAAQLAAVRLASEAELASDYFALRGADSQIALLESAVQDYDRAWQLTRNRYEQGTAAEVDVDQAETQRQNARAQLAAERRDRAQLEHALAVLVGEVPERFTIAPAELAAEPPAPDAGLPSTLLLRRPDVAAAERAMAAANAEIGVARAAWFPVFSLAGALGYESVAAGSWLAAPSRYWSVGPTGQLPLLDAGGRLALNRQARAAHEEAVANYRKVTVTAFQEVEDQLAALHWLGQERAADQAAAQSAERAAWHAERRYDAGVADYLEVTTTHTAALTARRAALTARVAQLSAAVALVRAAGGGFARAELEHPVLP